MQRTERRRKAVSDTTETSPEMNDDERSFWKRVFLKALPDCLAVQQTPEYCAHIAAECADAAIRELRNRTK